MGMHSVKDEDDLASFHIWTCMVHFDVNTIVFKLDREEMQWMKKRLGI